MSQGAEGSQGLPLSLGEMHILSHQPKTWEAKASTTTSFSFPGALLDVFSDQLQYFPH